MTPLATTTHSPRPSAAAPVDGLAARVSPPIQPPRGHVLRAEGLLSEERTRLLLSWRHSGFSVHTSVTVPPDDRDGLERLARYLLRAPVSLERLRVDEDAQASWPRAARDLGPA